MNACLCVQVINTMCGQDKQKLEFNDAKEHIHTDGCIDKLVDWIHSNLFILGGVALGLAIPQVEHNANNMLRVKAPHSPSRCVVSFCSWSASFCLRF